MQNEFDFKLSNGNEIIYHAKFNGKIYDLTWEKDNKKYNDLASKGEVRKYIEVNWWIPIVINKNRRLE
jgi:hypothetical protein